MTQKFSMFPLDKIATRWGGLLDGSFDDTLLPFEVFQGVFIENVSSLIPKDEFDYCKAELGTNLIEHLEHIKYGLIHRFPTFELDASTGAMKFEHEIAEDSKILIEQAVACLRLIRPFVQHPQFLGGSVGDDGSLRHIHFNHPIPFLSSLPNQTIMAIRTQDVKELKSVFPLFRTAMLGNYWKFRMSVDMFQSGYFQQTHWKLRFFMWTAALEALFTSHSSPEHRGGLVAKERVKELLGATTLIYPSGDLSQYESDPHLTVGSVIDEIYCLRNHLAHGDKVPDCYFQTTGRHGLNGPISKWETLSEAVSSIVRQSLMTILVKNLLVHFQDAPASEAYFGSLGLTKSKLEKKAKATGVPHFTCPS
jgi:hypothetical protein